jgi:DNA-binding NtrC family response regulator
MQSQVNFGAQYQRSHSPPSNLGQAVGKAPAKAGESDVAAELPRLLFVGVDEVTRQTAWEEFESAGCEFRCDESASSLREYLQRRPHFEVIVINLWTAVEECFKFISVIKSLCPRAEVIFISPFADERLWVESIQCGAYDLMPIPCDRREFRRVVSGALESKQHSH